MVFKMTNKREVDLKRPENRQSQRSKGKQKLEIRPVDRAYYESLILHDRWNVGKLYADNMFEGQKFRKQVKNMAHHRANELYGIDQEIDEMKKRIEDILLQKDNLKYLPTEQEIKEMRQEKQRKKRVRVIPDPRHQSVVILPPIHKTVPGRKKKSDEKKNKKQNTKKRKPLHAPKHVKTRMLETPRQRRYKKEYVEHDTPSLASAPTSVLSNYPASVRMYYPSSSTVSIDDTSALTKQTPFKYGLLYGKSSFDIHEKQDNKKASYSKNFYNEKDFDSTKARYISRGLRSSDRSLAS